MTVSPRLSRLGFIDVHRTLNPVRRRVRSRGVPLALDGREVFYTEHLAEAEHLISKTLGQTKVSLGDSDPSGFAAGMHGVRMRDVSVLYLDLHVAATLEIKSCAPCFAVHMPTNGSAEVVANGTAVRMDATRALITNPSDVVTLRLEDDTPQLIIRIEEQALERYLMRLIGRLLPHRLHFEPSFDMTTDQAMRWNAAVQLLHTEVFYAESLVRVGRGIGPLEEFLMSCLLLVQESNYSDQIGVPPSRPGRRAVRRSLDYIEEHLSEPITMADLAEHAAVSVRSIQQGFHDELGTTPTAYVRERRLERAYEQLRDAEPSDGVTVTAVALHWGFNHLGGFASLYRKRWGESPSQTLRS